MTTNPPSADPFNRVLATFWDALIQLAPQWLTLPITLLVGGVIGQLVGTLASLVGLALGLWNVYLLATTGQTLGKRFFGVRVVDAQGGPASMARLLLLRVLLVGLIACTGIGAVVLALGLWGMFQPGHRALHDHLAGTRVVMA